MPRVWRTSFFNLNFINENILKIEYKCHNQNYQKISIDNFFNIFKSNKCEICDEKSNCIYGLFCKDNYLYHILVSKYNINKEIILNNELIIEYHNIIYDNTIF